MSSSTQQNQSPQNVKSEPLKLALSFSGGDGEIVGNPNFLEDFMGEKSSSTSTKAIAEGTGHIIKGIFTCSNSYSKKIRKGGGVTTIAKEVEDRSGDISETDGGDNNKKNKLNTNIQRVEKLWKASEEIGLTSRPVIMLLEGGDMMSSVMVAPVVKSKLGKALLSTAPGEVILASLDSFNKILGAAEAAEIQSHSATSMAASRLVSKR
ncbi:PREDICTED: protein EARLY-RESPONSIVE TO DEHYDRATION 7, chloroplastic-like [Camelina sativa]|uniref:Protein EARLY-RESPONSIVE TO DEHYDRATION 7, chloroplastic-like n=1 Tax=Camelina sativa TaxID=90675 RepID=A0ABM0WB04_CAMSA|nr:PREDICTED: protein EARLY-RESPONSIVE TO DEHYDRATION 7, chloroplastic-like [Camelina sativa]